MKVNKTFRFLVACSILLLAIFALSVPVGHVCAQNVSSPPAQTVITEDAAPLDGLVALVTQWGALAGVAGAIAMVINILKLFNLVKDGQAQTWSAALNLGALVLFLALKIYNPALDLIFLDAQIAQVVAIGLVILGYLSQLGVSKLTHIVVKRTPVIGTTYSE
jgi:hypothetical protein